MSITSALNNALSGLNATSKLAEITAGNLANALTDGYGRQIVSLSGTVLGGHGTGVVVSGVDRASSPELTSARRIADGDMAGSDADDLAADFSASSTVLKRMSAAIPLSRLICSITRFMSAISISYLHFY